MMKKNWMKNVKAAALTAALTAFLAGSGTTAMEVMAAQNPEFIGWERAEEIVLAHLGIKESDLSHKDYDLDDGVYQLEFWANGREYEFDVNARDGKIVEAEQDRENNRWDDDDDRWDDSDDRWDDDDDDRWDDDDDRWDDHDDDRWETDDDDRWDDDDDDRWETDDDDRWDDDDDDRWETDDDDRWEDDDDDDRWDD